MKTFTGICALIVTAMALAPLTGFAQGQGQGQGQRQDRGAHQPHYRAQVERGQSDFDRDRMRDRDRIHQTAQDPEQDRDRIQDRTKAPDNAGFGDQDIYGHELMSVQERNQYREQLRLVESDPQQKTQLEAKHREEMQVRAREQGVTLDDPSEAQKAE